MKDCKECMECEALLFFNFNKDNIEKLLNNITQLLHSKKITKKEKAKIKRMTDIKIRVERIIEFEDFKVEQIMGIINNLT